MRVKREVVTSSAYHDVSHTLVVTRVNREVVTSSAHHDVSHTLVVMSKQRGGHLVSTS